MGARVESRALNSVHCDRFFFAFRLKKTRVNALESAVNKTRQFLLLLRLATLLA